MGTSQTPAVSLLLLSLTVAPYVPVPCDPSRNWCPPLLRSPVKGPGGVHPHPPAAAVSGSSSSRKAPARAVSGS